VIERERYIHRSNNENTHLTSLPTPLHPSLALVHGARSAGLRCVLLRVPAPAVVNVLPDPVPTSIPEPEPAPAVSRSSNGWVHAKGDTPRTKNSGRSGIRGRTGSTRRKKRRMTVSRSEVCVDRWMIDEVGSEA